MLHRPFLLATLLALPYQAAFAEAPRLDPSDSEQRQITWAALTPKGWRVLMETKGSLISSRSRDAIVVIEEADPAKIVANANLGSPELNLNPRAILVLAGAGSGYKLVRRIDGFLPSEGDADNTCLADPLAEGPGIAIDKQVLSIGLQYWYSCGSWFVTRNEYKFRAEKGRLRLIGMESWSFHRGGGMGSRTSMNFLTGRKKHIANADDLGPDRQMDEGEKLPKPQVSWSKISRGSYYLDSMKREVCSDYESAPVWCGFQ